MKRCPTCSRVYDDDNMRFCLDDGTTLIDRLDTADPPPTLAFSNKVPMATIEEVFRPDVAPRQHVHQPPTGPELHKKRSVPPWLLGIGALLVFGAGIVLAVLVLRPNRSLPWHLTFEMDQGTPNREAALKETASVIESRLNALGIPFEVKPQSDSTTDRILVSLPSVADPERIKRIISSGGKLELTHVISPPSPAPCQTYDTKEEAIASLNSGGIVPSNRRVLPYVEREELGSGPDQKPKKWAVVESPPIVDGSQLRTANALLIREGDYEIQFALKKAGAEKFGAWTGANINEYLAVVLNGEVESVAYIQSQISDSGVITGRFTKQAAEDLALTLKSGALPGRLILINESNDK